MKRRSIVLLAAAVLAADGVRADARGDYLGAYRSVDVNRAMTRLERLWRHEVRQTMSGKRAAAETVAAFLKEDGFSRIESIELPTDGKTACLDNRMPFAWEAARGRLTVVKRGDFVSGANLWAEKGGNADVLADYDVHPFHLVKGSTAVPSGGVVARVLSEAQFLAGDDAKGAVVVLEPDTWPRAKMLSAILDRGARGFVCDQLVGRFDTPDAIQWVTACTETSSWSPDAETRPFVGFSVSPRTGQRLRTLAAAGGVEVKVECDGRRVATTMPFVTAVVPGRKAQEFWILSHMYEPLASDDSNGVVAAIETARRFIGRDRPAYTVRVLFGIEYYGYAAYLERIGCPLRDRVVGAINLDSIPCQRDTFLNVQLAGPATPFCGNLVIESLAAELKGLPEMLDLSVTRMGSYFDDYFIADPLVGVPMVGALHDFKGTRYWHNSRQDIDFMDPETYRRSLAFAAVFATRLANPSESLLPSAAATAQKRLVRAKGEAKTAEHFAHLAALERRQLADFDRLLGAGAADAAVRAFDARAAALAKDVPSGPQADSPWRRYAAGIVPARKTVGFPQDLTRVPIAERRPLNVIYTPLANVIANMDGAKDLARLLRETEYENAVTLTEGEVAEYVRTVCFLGDWGYLAVTDPGRIGEAEIARALASAGIRRGDLVLVEDELDAIGPIAGGKATVLEALRAAVGSEGTVLLPAFNPSVRVCRAINRSWAYRPYDPKDFSSVAMTSPLAAFFLRRNPRALRSAHVVRSWSGFGPLARACLAEQKADAAPYGDDSPIAKALARKGKFVRLGGVRQFAELQRFLAVRAKTADAANALVGVRQRDGSSRDVAVADCPAIGGTVPALPDSARVTAAPLGLSRVSVIEITEE